MTAAAAVCGAGPAYVFHLVEALAGAGAALGLPEALAERLSRETVSGSGELLRRRAEAPSRLRQDVASPGGITAAALEVLMDPDHGFPALLNRAVTAAARRGEALGRRQPG